ncbi:hypothetical protein BDB00DRAFT_903292, partial [Zychaea mexicana]|uniref:uncharacterized protein n=1 Tax=Zychaea mexicana TaxID=64656 RepID=UPI0022FE7C20
MPVLASGPFGPLYGPFFAYIFTSSPCYFLSRLPYNPSPVSSHAIIACILHGLWSAHWRYVFDQVPF